MKSTINADIPVQIELSINELMSLKYACAASIHMDRAQIKDTPNTAPTIMVKKRIRRMQALKEKIQLACNKVYGSKPLLNNSKDPKSLELMYHRVKRMTPDEMREFVYWVYMNGNEDGKRNLQDSPGWGRSYFGGEMLIKVAKDVMPNDIINDLWDNFIKVYGEK